MSRSLLEDLNNPNLFKDNHEGEYDYGELEIGGKYATGSLKIADEPSRDSVAQSQAGGDLRRASDHDWGADDGGHLIGARFGGETGEENLTAQNRNLNRGSYKRAENDWAQHLEKGDKVFVHIETDSADRPNAYMGYAIYESPSGERTFETYHFVNESQNSIAQWEQDAAEVEATHPELGEHFSSETSYLGDVDATDEEVTERYNQENGYEGDVEGLGTGVSNDTFVDNSESLE